jgi:hypothetical protein
MKHIHIDPSMKNENEIENDLHEFSISVVLLYFLVLT